MCISLRNKSGFISYVLRTQGAMRRAFEIFMQVLDDGWSLFSILTIWIDGGELQTSNLQWVLTAVPVLKSLVLGLSFIFWYVSWSVQLLKILIHRAFSFSFFFFSGSTRSYYWAWLQECAIWNPALVRWEMMRLLSIATDNTSHYFDRKGQGVRRQRVGLMQASWVLRV